MASRTREKVLHAKGNLRFWNEEFGELREGKCRATKQRRTNVLADFSSFTSFAIFSLNYGMLLHYTISIFQPFLCTYIFSLSLSLYFLPAVFSTSYHIKQLSELFYSPVEIQSTPSSFPLSIYLRFGISCRSFRHPFSCTEGIDSIFLSLFFSSLALRCTKRRRGSFRNSPCCKW